MTKSEMAQRLNSANAWLPGKRVKLDFGSEGGGGAAFWQGKPRISASSAPGTG